MWAAIDSIAPKIGCGPQTLNRWIRKQEIDTGPRIGVTSDGRTIKEMRRANEILKLASSFLPRRSSSADSSFGALCGPTSQRPFHQPRLRQTSIGNSPKRRTYEDQHDRTPFALITALATTRH